MANEIDRQYKELLEHIIRFGVDKKDRTGTGTKSIFGWQIRHNMQKGFPLLTTKKMAWKSIVVELLWFLRGDTNIKYLVDNGCHIWDGDIEKRQYLKRIIDFTPMSKEIVERDDNGLFVSNDTHHEYMTNYFNQREVIDTPFEFGGGKSGGAGAGGFWNDNKIEDTHNQNFS